MTAVCPSCGASVPAGARFCATCGAGLAGTCPRCGTEIPDGARFCPSCGHQQAPLSETVEVRRIATILFADVVGSTALGERLDPERLRAVLADHFAAMTDVIATWGGSIEKFIGDAIMAAFGVSAVREDDARRALSAALEMMGRLATLNARLDERHGVTLALRIGVNTGEVIAPVGERVEQLIVAGDAVNIAARLQAVAEPGTILVGDRTWLATRDAFRFGEPRELELRGKGAPVVARVLDGPLVEAERGIPGLRAPLIGRDRELTALRSTLDDAIERGEPRLAVVYGVAGIGKSRLVWELVREAATRTPSPRVLRGRCLAAGHGITYWALAEILRSAVGVGLDDPADEVIERLRRSAGDLLDGTAEAEAREIIGALAVTAGIAMPDDPLAGMEPRAVDAAIGRAWPRFMSALAATGPLVVIVEDLHWAGGQLLETLARIAGRSNGPLLIVATARPEFAESHPGFVEAIGGSTSVSLRPLTGDQSTALVLGLLSVADLSDDRRRAIVERAEGNPFFLEEIVRRLIDEGAIVREGDRWRTTDLARSIVLPDTVHALLASRIDALAPRERAVLHEASVVGKAFWPAPIRLALPAIDVETALRALEDRGLVVARQASTIAGEPEYLFRHALIRDVAYEALPRARRARAHAAVAEWTERLAGDRSDEFAELVAHHYRLAVAGDEADLAWADEPDRRETLRQAAFRWLTTAGNGARRRYELEHAVDLHEQALELARPGPERAALLEALGDDHAAAFHGDEAVEGYMSAVSELEAAPGDPAPARLFMKAAREPAQKSGSFKSLVPPATVESWIDAGLAADPDDSTRAWLLGLRADVGVLWTGIVGHDPVPIDERTRAARDSIALARRLDLPSLESAVLGTLAQTYERAERFAESRASAEEMLGLASRLESSDRLEALVFTAEVIATIGGEHDRAERLLLEAEVLARELSLHEQLHVSGALVELYFSTGRWDDASAVVERHLRGFRDERDVTCARVRGGPLVGALLHAHRGETEKARLLLDLAPPSTVRISSSSEGMRARCLAALGEPEAALGVVEPVLARPTLLYLSTAHVGRLEALEVAGAWSAVPAAAEAALAKAGGDVVLRAVLDRVAGTAAANRGDAAAEERLADAVERSDRLGLPFDAARAREALAESTSDRQRAMALLASALATYRELGAAPSAARARERLASYATTAASS